MPDPTVLRLKQTSLGEDRYRVDITLDAGPRPDAAVEFEFNMSDQDHEDIRWYLEDYLLSPLDPGQAIAERVEKRMAEIGAELYTTIFGEDDDAQRVWDRVHDTLNETRVEIVSEVLEAAAIPWELMREPSADMPVALRAGSHSDGNHPMGETFQIVSA